MKKKKNNKYEFNNIDDPLFDYIKPKANDILSKMNGLDLQELLYYIENYNLELRDCLNIKRNITFGLEIECDNVIDSSLISTSIYKKKLNHWLIKEDGSLNCGLEINSPVLKDIQKSWKELEQICSILNLSSSINSNCGGHVHIGSHILGEDVVTWKNFIRLWSVYENVIYRFVYGEFLCARTKIMNHAVPISKKLWDIAKKKNISPRALLREIDVERAQAVNFRNVYFSNVYQPKNTIEFRCPNGSLEPVIWQNNVNLFVKLLEYAKESNYDLDKIKKRKTLTSKIYNNIELYNEVFLDQALELADMIFKTNYDKAYFLKQYLKSFEIDNRPLEKSKVFIKK